jgi:hypothetical protein
MHNKEAVNILCKTISEDFMPCGSVNIHFQGEKPGCLHGKIGLRVIKVLNNQCTKGKHCIELQDERNIPINCKLTNGLTY